MFRDQKLQVSSCVSNQKHDFLIYKKSSSSIFVQVQHKNFCSVKLQKVKFKSYDSNQVVIK